MAKAFVLTERERNLVQEVINRVRRDRINAPVPNIAPPGEDHQPPEVHVALVPAAGITALAQDTPGVYGAKDTPGVTKCDIYKVNSAGTLGQVPQITAGVHNVTTRFIANGWTPVVKSKYGKWLATTPSSDAVLWGKAQGNWSTGSPPSVIVQQCDMDGSNASGTNLTVQLPSPSSMDPNVRQNDVIAYTAIYDTGGSPRYLCVSGYLDDKIGTIKMWVGALADIPPGWALCDGNSGTQNLVDHFVRGTNSDGQVGTTGGYDSHGPSEPVNNHDNHTIQFPLPSLAIYDHDPHEFQAPAPEISIADHPAHDPLTHGDTTFAGWMVHDDIPPHFIETQTHTPGGPGNELDPHGPLYHQELDAHTLTIPHQPNPVVHAVQEGDTVDLVGGVSDGIGVTSSAGDPAHTHTIGVGGGELIHTIEDHHILDHLFVATHTPNPIAEHGTPDLTHEAIGDHDPITLTHLTPGAHWPHKHSIPEVHGGLIHGPHEITVGQSPTPTILRHSSHIIAMLPPSPVDYAHTETDNKPVHIHVMFIQRIN